MVVSFTVYGILRSRACLPAHLLRCKTKTDNIMLIFDYPLLAHLDLTLNGRSGNPAPNTSMGIHKHLQEQFLAVAIQAEALNRFRDSAKVTNRDAIRSLDKARASMQNAMNTLSGGMLQHEAFVKQIADSFDVSVTTYSHFCITESL